MCFRYTQSWSPGIGKKQARTYILPYPAVFLPGIPVVLMPTRPHSLQTMWESSKANGIGTTHLCMDVVKCGGRKQQHTLALEWTARWVSHRTLVDSTEQQYAISGLSLFRYRLWHRWGSYQQAPQWNSMPVRCFGSFELFTIILELLMKQNQV